MLTEVIFPRHLNGHETLFAGEGLSLMCKAAYLFVRREAGTEEVVMAKCSAQFHKPVPLNAVVDAVPQLTRKGRRSYSVTVEVTIAGETEPALSGEFVLVVLTNPEK